MVCRLLNFALAVIELLMFKVCGIISISKIEFFIFSGKEWVNFFRDCTSFIRSIIYYAYKQPRNFKGIFRT